jgi:8-oxo-dGTP pyrophosphatase MutT (NUDIX family)
MTEPTPSPNVIAAGILFRSPQGRVLLLRRAPSEDHPGEWSTPGGKLKQGETHEQAAVREVWEECRYRAGHAGKFHCRAIRDGCDYTTYIYDCDSEFTPTLNNEHDQWGWFDPGDALDMDNAP